MEAKTDFVIGDLVWAKMRCYPYWPAKIVKPPAAAPSKKAHHYVFFFGSQNNAWIQDINIVHHSDGMLQSASKHKSTTYKLAIEQISRESGSAPKKAKSPVIEKKPPVKGKRLPVNGKELPVKGKELPVKGKELPVKGKELPVKGKELPVKGKKLPVKGKKLPVKGKELPVKGKELPVKGKELPLKGKKLPVKGNKLSVKGKKLSVKGKQIPQNSCEKKSCTENKITKVQKSEVKTESLKSEKSTAPKKRASDESANKGTSPPQKLAKMYEDYSALISNTPPNLDYNRVAMIQPLDDRAYTLFSGITKSDYFEPLPSTSQDFKKNSESTRNRRPTEKKIGFIGLGMMGQRLVKNLITMGHNVTIWNRTKEKCDYFIMIGASIAETPSNVIEKCDITFCCVSGPEEAKSLVFGNSGILVGLENSPPGSKGYVEMTTIDPITSQEIADAIKNKGGRYLEAPISGSIEMAENGTLLILGAGDRELFNDCENCFYALCKNVYFLSCDVGSGSKMKLIISLLTGVSHAVLAEAIALVNHCNLAPNIFLEILELGPLNSPLVLEKGQSILRGVHENDTALKYQQKDVNMALSLGKMYQQPMLIAAAANKMFTQEKFHHYADDDISADSLEVKF